MNKVNQVQLLLKLTYGIVPIVAGFDKFTNLLTNWSNYLFKGFPIEPELFMKIVGIIEIIAGIIVFMRPVAGGYIVAVWLTCIALQLIFGGHYFDVAVRDLVMAIGALSLAMLSVTLPKKDRYAP